MKTVQNFQRKTCLRKRERSTSKICCILVAIVLFAFILVSVALGFYFYKKVPQWFKNFKTLDENSIDFAQNLEQNFEEQPKQNEFDVNYNIILTNTGIGKITTLTLIEAIIQDKPPYQDVLEKKIAPSDFKIEKDEFGNKFAKFEIYNIEPNEKVVIKNHYRVKVNSVEANLGDCKGNIVNNYLDPETFIESDNPKIKNLANKITKNDKNKCEKAKSIYNYVGDNLTYQGYNPGSKGALEALQSRGGDCTEFADLFIAIARAEGIPARFIEGFAWNKDSQKVVKHDWAEINLPGVGWVSVDPTWGRFKEKRDYYFARTDGTQIILTVGRSLDKLGGYHYYYFQYEGESGAEIDHKEKVNIELVAEE